jgi:hypothetical protein
VVNAATCNAIRSSGCGQTPAVVKVGDGTAVLAVSTKTDTIYAPSSGASSFSGHTMSVINGAACNGTRPWRLSRVPCRGGTQPGRGRVRGEPGYAFPLAAAAAWVMRAATVAGWDR